LVEPRSVERYKVTFTAEQGLVDKLTRAQELLGPGQNKRDLAAVFDRALDLLVRELEYHHRHPFARGGEQTEANLELRCRAHNALAAEEDYGAELMASRAGHCVREPQAQYRAMNRDDGSGIRIDQLAPGTVRSNEARATRVVGPGANVPNQAAFVVGSAVNVRAMFPHSRALTVPKEARKQRR
jgi:hypothetical protein